MLWQIIFLTAGVLSLIYYSAVCIALKKWDSTFSRFWLFTGIAELTGSVLTRLYGMPCLAEVLIGIGVCFFLFAEINIIKGMEKPEEDTGAKKDTKWIIVLGAQVKGRRITDSLKRRLDTACEYLQAHPEVWVIVSGGQGKDEEVTEAYAMAQYLESAGIDGRRIVLEEASVNTLENLKFSAKIVDDVKAPTGIVSNNFHVYRGCKYAEYAGFENPFPIAAGCHPVLFPNYFVRECFAVWKMWTKKWLKK